MSKLNIGLLCQYIGILQNTDANKKVSRFMTEFTDSGVSNKLNNLNDANPKDNYDVVHNTLSVTNVKHKNVLLR